MNTIIRLIPASLAVVLLTAVAPLYAQESAYADLDSCVKSEQIATTAKGAAFGALAGLGGSLFGNKKDDAPKMIAVGAVVGGAAGFAKAYYTATDTCFKKNPSWIPASRIERTKSLVQTRQQMHYKASEGIKTYTPQIAMAPSVKAGTSVPVTTTFAVLTPNEAETKVIIDRKLYLIEDGKEEEIRVAAPSQEERTLEPGTHTDTVDLNIQPGIKAGTMVRYEFRVSADNHAPSLMTGTTVVQ